MTCRHKMQETQATTMAAETGVVAATGRSVGRTRKFVKMIGGLKCLISVIEAERAAGVGFGHANAESSAGWVWNVESLPNT